MAAVAKCDFLHKGVNYRKDEAVNLGIKELTALSGALLVELDKQEQEPSPPGDKRDKQGEQDKQK